MRRSLPPSRACVALGLAGLLSIESAAWAQPLPPSAAPPPAAPAVAAPAAANTAPPAPIGDSLSGEAKDDYDAGRSLFLHADYPGALVKFQRAYELSYDPRLLWDMGSCELNLKHYVRVLKLVQRYLQEGGAKVADDQRAAAEAMLRKIRPLVSEVRLIVDQPGAQVFVDDELAGTTPLAQPLVIDLGDRRLRVSKPGFKDETVTQHVVGASDMTVTLTLQAEVHQGRLAVRTESGAAVAVDGSTVSVGPWEGTLAPGQHTLRITDAGMRPYTADVEMRDGEVRTLDVTLVRESGGISPWWWIGGGIVAAAGLSVGAYYLFRPSPGAPSAVEGTISPYTLTIQSR
ncbi:MAG TPA: PEGA domain-containing protein [Polyangiaceae bacterium]|jgi:hypothetical protein|nr:PEGA domain-containing protein [Polyangiaceae bacterium]